MLYLNNSVSNFSNNSYISTIVVYTLIFGTFISYSPQYYRMYKKKTVKGISEYMLIFGYFSCFFNLIGTINENNNKISNCIDNSSYDYCSVLLISLLQLSSPLLCAIIFYGFFNYYIKSSNSKSDYLLDLYNDPNSNSYYLDSTQTNEILTNKYINNVRKRLINTSIFTCIIIFISLIIYHLNNDNSNNIFGITLNILSAVFSILMWVPQLSKTIKLKNNYSLSILAMFIHSMGCLLTVFYQTLVAHQQFYVVLCYIIGFLFEISICIIVLYNRFKFGNNINNINNINNKSYNSNITNNIYNNDYYRSIN